MSDAALLEVQGGVATLTVNEPDQMNALTPPVLKAMNEHLDTVEERDDVRCVVLEGTGRAFSAGGDIEGMKDRLDAGTPVHEAVEALKQGANETVARLITCTYPTVAKIDGPAVGAGANFAIGCDIVLANESARIGFGFNQVGLSVDTATSYLLPRLVGINKAKELVFTGEVLDAHEAEELGLFNHVYPNETFEDEVTAMVEKVASGPTVALSQSKQLLHDGFNEPLQRALRNEAAAHGVALDSDDHHEGIEAFLENREPEFEGK